MLATIYDALSFLNAMTKIFLSTQDQCCWSRKIPDMLVSLQKGIQQKVKAKLVSETQVSRERGVIQLIKSLMLC